MISSFLQQAFIKAHPYLRSVHSERMKLSLKYLKKDSAE